MSPTQRAKSHAGSHAGCEIFWVEDIYDRGWYIGVPNHDSMIGPYDTSRQAYNDLMMALDNLVRKGYSGRQH